MPTADERHRQLMAALAALLVEASALRALLTALYAAEQADHAPETDDELIEAMRLATEAARNTHRVLRALNAAAGAGLEAPEAEPN